MQEAQVQVRGRELGVQLRRSCVFPSRVFPALETGVRVAELEMCEGIVGPVGFLFFERLRRRGVVFFFEGLLRASPQRLERPQTLLFLRRGRFLWWRLGA